MIHESDTSRFHRGATWRRPPDLSPSLLWTRISFRLSMNELVREVPKSFVCSEYWYASCGPRVA